MAFLTVQYILVMALVAIVSHLIGQKYIRPYSQRLSSHREILADTVDDEYDYIIVGGGTGGCVVAGRLAEDKSKRVLLLEAGGFYDENPTLHSLAEWFLLRSSDVDWSYVTESQTQSSYGMYEQRSFWPRGCVLGGSGMINAMQYVRGNRTDYDEWESMGCKGWGYRDVLPYFLKSEDIQIDNLKSSKYHSIGGPLAVGETTKSSLSNVFLQAAKDLGYDLTDYNGETQEGFGHVSTLVRNGFRESTSLAYLGRRGKQTNLDIVINAFVAKIKFEYKRATGVFYIRNGRKYFVKARKEIVLSAGVINTPQILMLSGIGPRDHLDGMNIPVVQDLPVGDNLQDHLVVLMYSNINQSLGINTEQMSGMWPRLQRELFGSGPLVTTASDDNAFLPLDKSTGSGKTNTQFIIASLAFSPEQFNIKDEIVNEITSRNGKDCFTVVLANTKPKSRGTLRLKSTDPFDHPLIDPRYLTEDEDVKDHIGGIRIWEKFVQTPTMKSLGVDINQMKMSFCSKHEFRSDAYWECFVRHLALTEYHPCGTCKMGSIDDPSAVLDPELRVRGIKGLRVADASVFPTVIRGNINDPVIMVAEKAVDMIKGTF